MYGFSAAIPSFLTQRSLELPTQLTDEDVIAYAEQFGLWMRAVRLEVVEKLHMYDSRSKAYYDEQQDD